MVNGHGQEPIKMAVVLRETTKDALDYVRTLELNPQNSRFIRQWSLERHLQSIGDQNEAHFLALDESAKTPRGFAILIGLQDEDDSLQLKRLVIETKGRGYGRQAMRAIKQFAFHEVRCHRLWLDVLDGNDRARGLYESAGFRVEGVSRESFKWGDSYASLFIMSILANEYIRLGSQ
jgi:RimJ/RimL family protein N-acetyltransferase